MRNYLGKKDLILIANPLGIIMQGIGAVILIPIIIALIFDEPFIGSLAFGLFSIGLGSILRRLPADYNRLKLKHGMIIASVAWLWAALIGSFCLMYSTNIDFLNAYFESMSAWSGSGLSIYADVEILPKSVLFLRSLEQWVGGLGVVIVVIGILIRPGTAAARLYKSEAREEKIKPSITSTVKTIWWIYLLYTIIGIILYVLAGMPLFDAINNTFTNLSTGGMSIKNDNIGAYGSTAIYIITMILMIIGGTSFLVHYKALKGRVIDVFHDIQFQAMIIILSVFYILLVVNAEFTSIDSAFFVISALSCTGSNIQPVSAMINWPDYAKVVILGAMIIGMSAGSTTGAVKLIRVVTLIKGFYWEIKRILSPQGSIIPRKISGKPVDDVEIREAGSYTFIYLIFIFISWLVMVSYGFGAIDSLFEVASAQGNVGLSMGIVSANMPDVPQIFMIFNMWIGRIEIIPALVLLKGLWDVFKG
ncbi:MULTISPECIES: TrkH family potassium uptake protein [Methanobacterium]|jgi:trk system potassium uptake protein TrkH|uniref:Potassium transporter n=2 Tax=Methanobacterium subterraneum TaxID=59277 RepID=A0A2H4VRF8_9EURY|nr:MULTISPECIES: TrkH family potassium uptake protein [Methanobacterium]MBW4256104.1 TrkH family potassium uptake protein [Methanobacterium sp. YSL]AUB55468.1 potassium transporter [Methanobacterium subterraneum]AUB57559.1 potassium transporter [Methanobacterium sp. MZ-A1]AUB60681.1 potassium transporter [Methanobacterium subterraneum]MCC7559548.1 TrkH family potassium uptake protein [Methanobacterium sp.]